MPVRGFSVALVLLVCLAGTAPAAHAGVLAADNFTPSLQHSGFRDDVGYRSPPGHTPVFLNMAPAQRFVASEGGPLESLTTYVHRWFDAGVTPALHVSLRADDGGKPGATLGERAFAAALVPEDYPPATTFDLSPLGVVLEEGRAYHVVFRTATPHPSLMHYSLHVLRPHANSLGQPAHDSTDGGATWTLPPMGGSFDLELPIQVRLVPEPAGAALAVVGVLAAARRRRR